MLILDIRSRHDQSFQGIIPWVLQAGQYVEPLFCMGNKFLWKGAAPVQRDEGGTPSVLNASRLSRPRMHENCKKQTSRAGI